jgi:hypothetical protein
MKNSVIGLLLGTLLVCVASVPVAKKGLLIRLQFVL